MMMTLGMMVFMRQTLPYQGLQHNVDYRWPTNNRVGQRATAQFLGPGDEKITLSGLLLPEITGGKVSLATLKALADLGRAWPLIGGDGTIYGMYVVENINTNASEFFSDGSARRIEFNASLLRVDESLTAMFGDLKTQANDLLGQGNNLSSSVQSVIGSLSSQAQTIVGGLLS
ncbi:phage tail protein [Rouxiella chamberiensis]|uniref:phage tail protein n=1 Tax=Rouxiella chamberiensis TaxID=1513468 RepID=UPI0005D33564|nr:phage tail protein [Rouxiella chamberiensis]